jgi:hypothetical protein
MDLSSLHLSIEGAGRCDAESRMPLEAKSADPLRECLSQLGALLLEPLVRRNGPVGEREPAPLAAPDHQSDGVVEKSAGNSRIFNLAGTFKIVPGNLN